FFWTWRSGNFWRANLKSFWGMATVGAEISGILTYASGMDGFVADVTGVKDFALFHGIGAFVDGKNGAISWGSALLDKVQDWSGLHVADATMNLGISVSNFVTGSHDA